MIRCQEAKKFISLRIDDDINIKEQKQLKEHLVYCLGCQEYAKEIDALHSKLLDAPDVVVKESIVDKLVQSGRIEIDINNYKEQKLYKRAFKPWVGVFAAALLIGLAIPLTLLNKNNVNDHFAQSMESTDSSMNKEYGLLADDNKSFEFSEGIMEKTKTDLNQESDSSAFKESRSSEIGNPDSIANFIGLTSAAEQPYKVEEQKQQLIVFQDEKEIFRTKNWDESLKVQWIPKNETIINYYLYDVNDNLIEKYQIDLSQKIEKIIND